MLKAVSQGAKIVIGGKPIDRDGYYYYPTILSEVTKEMDIFNEEVFGPVVSITKFSTENEAIELANHSEFGLAASIWTKKLDRAHRVANELETGITWINGHHRKKALRY